jgi:putative ABC transport system permease protein
MMDHRRSVNRSMFWRVLRRSLFANGGRLFVILLALGTGSAVTAALLNLQIDAKRRITTEFRAFGANVVIGPRESGDSPRFLSESLVARIPDRNDAGEIARAVFLYGVVGVSLQPGLQSQGSGLPVNVPAILAGYGHSGAQAERVLPAGLIAFEQETIAFSDKQCAVGQKVASALKLPSPGVITMDSGVRQVSCRAAILPSTGGPEDSQLFMDLRSAQNLLAQQRRISVIQISVPGNSKQVQSFVDQLQREFPDAEGHPIRQFTEGEARLYDRISGILAATVAVVLVLTALCVMAAMTNVAMERKNDVGLMKAIGGSVRRVLRLFLAEAALLGLAGGLIGAAVGIVVSIGLGKAVFGVAAQPRLIVYPISVALTIIVAILAAYPLRRLAQIRPASVFRGEE